MAGQEDKSGERRKRLDELEQGLGGRREFGRLPPGKYIEGESVYEQVIGGKPRRIGQVIEGMPYRDVIGGKPTPMGLIGARK